MDGAVEWGCEKYERGKGFVECSLRPVPDEERLRDAGNAKRAKPSDKLGCFLGKITSFLKVNSATLALAKLSFSLVKVIISDKNRWLL